MEDPLVAIVQAELRAEQERQKAKKTAIQTEIQTTSQTIVQTGVETANTAQKQGKTTNSDNLQKTQKQDSNNDSKNLETIPKNDSKNEENELFIEEEQPEDWEAENEEEENENLENDPDYVKEGPDPLLDMAYDPGDTTVEEQVEKSTGESIKSLETLAALGEMVMDYLDNSKAQICAAISGKEAALFASDQKAKKALVEATKKYVQEVGLKPPTPTQTFLLAVGMWLLPSLGLAGFERFKLMKSKKKAAIAPAPAEQVSDYPAPTAPVETVSEEKTPAPTETTNQGTQIDYTKCKEYQENRRLFDRHAKGTYRHLSDGTYANVDLATEYPSTEVLKLLDAGYKNAEIRETLYGE